MIPERIKKIHEIAFGVDLKKENLRCFTEAVISLDVLELRVSGEEKKIVERMILRLYEYLGARCKLIREREFKGRGVDEMDISIDGQLFRGKVSHISKVLDGCFLFFEDDMGKARGKVFLNAGDCEVLMFYLMSKKKPAKKTTKKKDLETVKV